LSYDSNDSLKCQTIWTQISFQMTFQFIRSHKKSTLDPKWQQKQCLHYWSVKLVQQFHTWRHLEDIWADIRWQRMTCAKTLTTNAIQTSRVSCLRVIDKPMVSSHLTIGTNSVKTWLMTSVCMTFECITDWPLIDCLLDTDEDIESNPSILSDNYLTAKTLRSMNCTFVPISQTINLMDSRRGEKSLIY
jgi:hypothetical protein